MKYFTIITLLLISTLKCQVSEYDIYENLHIDSESASSAMFGNTVMGALPFELSEITKTGNFFGSFSFNYYRGGVKFGRNSIENEVKPERITLDNIDFVKSALLIYQHKYDFRPFVSYSTPYKYQADINLQSEVSKRQDLVSVGFISPIEGNVIAMSFDFNLSTLSNKDGNSTVNRYAYGLSNRILVNFKTNKRSSVEIGAVTPVYFIQKGSETRDENMFLNRLIISTAFKYDDGEKYFGSYNSTYREFNRFVNREGYHLNYPWVIEHKLTGGYHINSNVRLLFDYQLKPSVYQEPKHLSKYRHSIGGGLAYRLDRSFWNFYFSDNRLFGDEEMKKSSFQMDVGLSF